MTASLSKAKPRSKGSGIVKQCIRNRPGEPESRALAPSSLIPQLKAGLPFAALEELQAGLDLGISKATLHRRKSAGRLDAAESDRVVRFARLLGKAASVMESLEEGRRWLTSPQVGLGGAVPLEYAETEVGAREVENLLGRIEYGVYS